MLPGSRNGGPSTNAGNGDKPVIFQKYFKNGNRTYASQVKISQIGKKYLVLTEGVRDPKTQDLRKHTICVFEQDLKQFFAILQETVLYLRGAKDTVASVPTMAEKQADRSSLRPAMPPIAANAASNGNGAKTAAVRQKPATPVKGSAAAKPGIRPGAGRQPASAPAAKGGYRSANRANAR